MWPEFLHHITLHFPIVLSLALALTGHFARSRKSDDLLTLIHYSGLFTLAITALTVLSGFAAAGLSGGDPTLVHHRYLGALAGITIAIASLSVHFGIRRDLPDLTSFGLLTWWAAALATTGAAHWGSWAEHPELIPF